MTFRDITLKDKIEELIHSWKDRKKSIQSYNSFNFTPSYPVFKQGQVMLCQDIIDDLLEIIEENENE